MVLRTSPPGIPSAVQKERRTIRAMFDRFAGRYDLFNAFASFGQVDRWRRALARHVRPGWNVLDTATGTGAQAFVLARAMQGRGKIIGIDSSEGMLRVARHKLQRSPSRIRPSLRFVRGEMARSPFRDGRFDAVTCAFAMRNVQDIAAEVLREMHRVLRPGGRVLILELTRPRPGWLSFLHAIVLRLVLPVWGRLILRETRGHRYLIRSVGRFPDAGRFVSMMRKAGFSAVRMERMSGGAATIFTGRKRARRQGDTGEGYDKHAE